MPASYHCFSLTKQAPFPEKGDNSYETRFWFGVHFLKEGFFCTLEFYNWCQFLISWSVVILLNFLESDIFTI